jgi:hypothetical protein
MGLHKYLLADQAIQLRIRSLGVNGSNVEKVLHVLSENKDRAFSTREIADAVGVDYEKNWNKRSPRIIRRLTQRGYALRTVIDRRVFVSLDPRWLQAEPAAIRKAYAERQDRPCRAIEEAASGVAQVSA